MAVMTPPLPQSALNQGETFEDRPFVAANSIRWPLRHRLVEGHPVVRLTRGAVQPMKHDALRRADRDGRIQSLHLFDDGTILVAAVCEVEGPINTRRILINQADGPDLQLSRGVGERQRATIRGVAEFLDFDLAGPGAEELRGVFSAIDKREWKAALHRQSVEPNLRPLVQHHPGIGPIALVPTTAIARIIHDQVELLRSVQGHVNRARGGVGAHDLGGEGFVGSDANPESAGRLRVVHVSIQPDHGHEFPGGPIELHPQSALGVHADAARINLVPQPNRSASRTSAQFHIPGFILVDDDQAAGQRGWKQLLRPLLVQRYGRIHRTARCHS